MGLFKGSKDVKQTAGLMSSLMAQQQAVMGQAMAHQAAAAGALGAQPGGLDPIGGVSIERYAEVVRSIAAYNYDQSMLPSMAAERGIAADAWHTAHAGWNARIQSDPGVARRFSDVYHASM